MILEINFKEFFEIVKIRCFDNFKWPCIFFISKFELLYTGYYSNRFYIVYLTKFKFFCWNLQEIFLIFKNEKTEEKCSRHSDLDPFLSSLVKFQTIKLTLDRFLSGGFFFSTSVTIKYWYNRYTIILVSIFI